MFLRGFDVVVDKKIIFQNKKTLRKNKIIRENQGKITINLRFFA